MQQACQRCGKRFEQHGADRYCPECTTKTGGAEIKVFEGYKKTCSTCGKEFTTMAKAQKYCSDECRPSAYTKSYTKAIEKVVKPITETVNTNPIKAEENEPPKIVVKEVTLAANDPVKHPSHYTRGTIETKDFIRDHGHNFNRGSAIKYIDRAGFKDPSKEVEDLQKAVQFLQFEIEWLTKEQSHEH